MIKKILTAICAFGLLFASFFVGRSVSMVETKAETYYLPNTGSASIQVINGKKFVPFFSLLLLDSSTNLHSFTVLNQYVLPEGDGVTAQVGGEFAILYHAGLPSANYSIALFRNGQSNAYYMTGLDISALFDWSDSNSLYHWQMYGSVTYYCSAVRNGSSNVQVTLSNAPLSWTFTFLSPLDSIIGYWISTSASTSFNITTSVQTCRPIFYSSVGADGAIYNESQYLEYGNSRYAAGQTAGYNSGYAAGLAAGNGNSFLGLITAVVDAPITAFTSLLDFEILGFNMRSVVLSLLTAAFVIACLRLFSGKMS